MPLTPEEKQRQAALIAALREEDALPPVAPPRGTMMTTGLGPDIDRATHLLPPGDRNDLQGLIDKGLVRFNPELIGYNVNAQRLGEGKYAPMEINPDIVSGSGDRATANTLAHEIQHGRQGWGLPEKFLPFPMRLPYEDPPAGLDPDGVKYHEAFERYSKSPIELEARFHGSQVSRQPRLIGPPEQDERIGDIIQDVRRALAQAFRKTR